MPYLSIKETNNQPITIYRKSNLFSFMNLANQRLLTKRVYFLHKANNGKETYLYFKSVVPRRMEDWASKKNIDAYGEIVFGGADILDSLNKKFIADSHDLYSCSDQNYMPLEANVYKSKLRLTFSSLDGSQHAAIEKGPGDLLAHDYGNLDVWDKYETAVDTQFYRYRNEIPFWQRTMNNRHYDRGNQGYHHANPNRSSLDVPQYGYGNKINKLVEAKEKKNKRNGVFSL